MNSNPKRPWFRFHLLTAVLIMVTAGGVIGINFTAQRLPPFKGAVYGWPYYVVEDLSFEEHGEFENKDNQFLNNLTNAIPAERGVTIETINNVEDKILEVKITARDKSLSHLLLDAGVFLLILAAVALISESIIRRRARRKP
jgi:hypothetical protein